MQRGPAKAGYGYVEPAREERGERPMSMLEAALFFGLLVLMLDAFGSLIGRAVGVPFPVCVCGNVFLYAAAGFVAARYTTTTNGVWAGIMVAALDAVFGQLVIMAILPAWREWMTASAGSQATASMGVIGFVIVLYVIVGALTTVIMGSFWGFLGAAISQLSIFRPKDYYAEEY